VVKNWMKGRYRLGSMLLHPILEKVKGMALIFSNIYCYHILQ
jgi:hypothetical protein